MERIKLLSWNINGIRAIHRKGTLEWFLINKPDILCVQETKAQEDQVPDEIRNIDGYHTYFDSAERKGYSGVATYAKLKPHKVSTGLGIKKFDVEGRALQTEFENFILFNIYFPNGKASKERLAYKMEFYGAFFKYSERLRKSGKNIIICGDVNTAHKEIDLSRPKENAKVSGFLPEERAWIDKLIKAGYIDTFRKFNNEPGQYTWWDMKSRARERNVGWRIDYFFVSSSLEKNLKSASILSNIQGSDHCPIYIVIEI